MIAFGVPLGTHSAFQTDNVKAGQAGLVHGRNIGRRVQAHLGHL